MRFLAVIPIVLSTVALCLSLLCMFAGSRQGFMTEYAILTVRPDDILRQRMLLLMPGIPARYIKHPSELFATSELNSEYLGSHDFYSIYVLNLCEGQYSPDGIRPVLTSNSNRRNITSCGDKTFTFNFDLRKTLGLQVDGSEDHSIDTPKSGWPPEVNNGMRAFETIPRIMSVVYCISLTLTTVALALAVFGIFFSGRCSACVNIMFSSIATLAAGVASILATLLGRNTAELVNAEGTQINISAQTGTKFLRLTWAATACMLAASLLWCLACIRGR